MWPWILAGIAILAVLWFAARANELFFVSVRDGKVLLVRGRIPQGLLNDFKDAVQKPPVKRGYIKAVKTPGGAQLYGGGDIDEFVEQRLRNIFNFYPAARLRAASTEKRTMWQVLGITSLAWLFDRSSGE